MPIQKNNSCRMGGPEKDQQATIILKKASISVCEIIIIYQMKSFQDLIFRYWEASSNYYLHQTSRKRIPIFLTRVTERSSLLLWSNVVVDVVAFHHVNVAEIPYQTKAQLNILQMKQDNQSKTRLLTKLVLQPASTRYSFVCPAPIFGRK